MGAGGKDDDAGGGGGKKLHVLFLEFESAKRPGQKAGDSPGAKGTDFSAC
jgi:hypothetical protein